MAKVKILQTKIEDIHVIQLFKNDKYKPKRKLSEAWPVSHDNTGIYSIAALYEDHNISPYATTLPFN